MSPPPSDKDCFDVCSIVTADIFEANQDAQGVTQQSTDVLGITSPTSSLSCQAAAESSESGIQPQTELQSNDDGLDVCSTVTADWWDASYEVAQTMPQCLVGDAPSRLDSIGTLHAGNHMRDPLGREHELHANSQSQ